MTDQPWTPCQTNPDMWTEPTDTSQAKQAAHICITQCQLLDTCMQIWKDTPPAWRTHLQVWAGQVHNSRRKPPCPCGKPHATRGLCHTCNSRRRRQQAKEQAT